MIKKAVIPAAGLGTRFLPVTKSMPKEMLPIIDKPIIQFVVEEAIISGIEDIIIITGRGKRAIEDFFDTSPELESHLFQNEIQLTDAIRMLIKNLSLCGAPPHDLASPVRAYKKALPKKNHKEKRDVYAYKFEGRRYDAGDKLGYVKAIIDFALEREDLRGEIEKYLRGIGEGGEI